MSPTRVLIMGLPGVGKTTLAKSLKEFLESKNFTVDWFNADDIRKRFDDWDFSIEGRIRQSLRMRYLADHSKCHFSICDFVAPLEEMRMNFGAHVTVWVDTMELGRFQDTNKMFEAPPDYDFRVTEQNSEEWARTIGNDLVKLP